MMGERPQQLSVVREDEESPGERCLSQLLELIVSLEYAPGQIVSERELMERTESSRTALRQAVIRLAELGLITPLARKGLVVTPLDVADVSAVYEARLTIERGIVRAAAQRAMPEQIARLEELREGASSPDPGADGIAFLSADLAVHRAIAEAGRNMHLQDALARILPLTARLVHRVYREVGTRSDFMVGHDEVITAIARRDQDAAEAAVVLHLQAARDAMIKVFTPLWEEAKR